MENREIKFIAYIEEDDTFIRSDADDVEKFSFYRNKLGIKLTDGTKKFVHYDNVFEDTILSDCDGKKLWEKDIITILNTPDGRDPNVVVEFRAGMFGFMMDEGQDKPTFYPLARFVPKYAKKIGNYTQNADLLDEAAQKAAHALMYQMDGEHVDG